MTQAVMDYTPPSPSLTRLAITGSAWTILGYGTSQFLRLAGNIILSRLLFPEAFGLMALVTAFLVGLDMFSDLGIAQSVIRSPDGDQPSFLNTAWTLQILRGAALWVGSCALAFPASHFYSQPELAHLLPIVGLTALIAGFNSTSLYALNRSMSFRTLTFIDLSTQITSLTVMVLYALFIQRSVWALAVGSITASILRLTISHFIIRNPHRPRIHWNRPAARELFSFGQWIFLSTLLTFVGSNADRFIFGKLGSISWLGMYSIALALAMLPAAVILKIGSSVTFPAYSRIFARSGDLSSAFRRSRLPLLLVGGLMTSCLLVAGPATISLLYDQRYHDAGLLLQLLAINVWFQILECTNGALLLAIGKSATVAAGNIAKLACMCITIPLGFHLLGIKGAILGFCLADIGRYLVLALSVRRQGLSCLSMDFLLTLLVAAITLLSLTTLHYLPPHLPYDRVTRF
ncbi:MAG TPA: oligosaccharide flippase family protein, partial [Tepidisphaeraceae bacterium]|nr:oligosaccharide flippase family protein [Tepidisphaeraceae bacterium]